jgi:hypothetical protein
VTPPSAAAPAAAMAGDQRQTAAETDGAGRRVHDHPNLVGWGG